MTTVKICGITNLEDACVAAAAGADMLGFIFYPPSPRCVTPQQARAIVDALTQERLAPVMVGVFVNDSLEHVQQVMAECALDLTQLHGKESVETFQALAPQAYKTLQPHDLDDARGSIDRYRPGLSGNTPAFMIDGAPRKLPGGNGVCADWNIAREIARDFPILLAGGLTVDNVAEAIEIVQPWGVDVSSGIERAPGLKDHAKVRQFIDRVKARRVEAQIHS